LINLLLSYLKIKDKLFTFKKNIYLKGKLDKRWYLQLGFDVILKPHHARNSAESPPIGRACPIEEEEEVPRRKGARVGKFWAKTHFGGGDFTVGTGHTDYLRFTFLKGPF
jgi:hypothetical protein